MPTNTSYSSATAVIHADGSTALAGVKYTWNGQVFVKSVDPEFANVDAAASLAQAQTVGNQVEMNIWSAYNLGGGTTDNWINPQQIAYLRLAIEKGFTTVEKAVANFGYFKVVLIRPFAFQADSLPSTITAEQEASLLLPSINTASLVTLSDVLTKPNSFVDSTAHPVQGAPWTIPAGTTTAQAISNAWASSTVPGIAAAAAATQGVSTGSGSATAAVPFALTQTVHQDAIQKAYLAFFLRPADGVGFNYYADSMNHSGGDLSQMTAGFGASPEYLQTYAGLSTPQRIDAIYQNLFNRPAEAAGVEYWGSRLDSGTFSINNIAISILVGAQNSDLLVVNNRVSVARQFTNTFDSWSEVNSYSGLESAASARALMKLVTDDPATVFTAGNARAEVFKTLGASATVQKGSTGDTITLSSASKVDVLVFSPDANVGRTDTVVGFSGDKLDLSNFRLPSTSVGIRDLAAGQSLPADAFSGTSKVVIAHVGANSYVYVDANKSGAFEAASDVIVKVVGVVLTAADLVI